MGVACYLARSFGLVTRYSVAFGHHDFWLIRSSKRGEKRKLRSGKMVEEPITHGPMHGWRLESDEKGMD
jgi:hypothetical protein